jgi:hypothetical protein
MRLLPLFQETLSGGPAPKAKAAIVGVQQRDRGMVLDRERAAVGPHKNTSRATHASLLTKCILADSATGESTGLDTQMSNSPLSNCSLFARLDLGVPDRAECGLECVALVKVHGVDPIEIANSRSSMFPRR